MAQAVDGNSFLFADDFAALANPLLRRNETDLAFAQSLLRGGRGGVGEDEPVYLIEFDWSVEGGKSSTGEAGLLGSELLMAAVGGRRSILSDVRSSSSTVKNVEMVNIDEDDHLGDVSSSPSQRIHSPPMLSQRPSRLSLQEVRCFFFFLLGFLL